jgi:GAF domain-containing protein
MAPSRHYTPEAIDEILDRARLSLDLGLLLRILDDFDAVLGTVLDLALHLIPSDAGSILLVTEEGHELHFKEAAGPKGREVVHFRLKAGEGVAGWVAKHGEPANIPDAVVDPRHSPRVSEAVAYDVRTILCVPLRVGDEILGAMELINKKPRGAYTEGDLVLMSALSERVAAVIDKARLQRVKDQSYESLVQVERTLSRKIEELGVLYEIERKVNSSLPLDRILDILTEVAVSALHAEAGSIYVFTEGKDALCFQTARGSKASEVAKITLRPGQGFAGWVVENREPLLVNDVAGDPRHRKDIAEKVGFPVHTMVCVPMMRGDRCIGAFQVMNKVRMDFCFSPGDLALLQMIASQAAKLIENHWLERERAKQANLATLGRFVSSVLHDIRSPLSTISGFAEILGLDTTLPEETRRRYLDFVLSDVVAIRSMADEILEYTKGERNVERREVDVASFLGSFRELLDRRLKGRPIDIRVEPEGELGSVSADARKLERAFLNLANNAADAMEGGGSLSIGARVDDGHVLFTFRDTGMGIPHELMESLFEPFVSGKNAHAGLGLSIVKQIVEAHGGTVEAAPAPEVGTEFRVRIPRG